MTDDAEELVALEQRAWDALSTEGAAGPFYADVLADRVLMLLPGGLVVDDRDQVIESMGGAPWERVDLDDARVLPLGSDAAVVAYRATAARDGTDYAALFNSTYVRGRDGWELVLHQQTPV